MRRLVLPLSILTWLGVWAALRFGVRPPIPGQVMGLYMAITTVAILVYLMADQARFQSFLSPLVALLRENRLAVPRILLLSRFRCCSDGSPTPACGRASTHPSRRARSIPSRRRASS